eukprot:5473564-Pyramimonas_sp.AAC.1
MNCASPRPMLADELMGVELDPIEVNALDVARGPKEPPNGQAASNGRSNGQLPTELWPRIKMQRD